jgi:hypothetical protein
LGVSSGSSAIWTLTTLSGSDTDQATSKRGFCSGERSSTKLSRGEVKNSSGRWLMVTAPPA